MTAIGMGLVWAGYLIGLKGWALIRGWNITLAQLANPVHPYAGPWPPPQIPPTQVFASATKPGGK